jgi:hypothetical protein
MNTWAGFVIAAAKSAVAVLPVAHHRFVKLSPPLPAEARFLQNRRLRTMRGFPALVAQRHGGSLNPFPFGETLMIAPNLSTLQDSQSQFVAFLPALSGRLSTRFRHRDPEARADAIAEGIGIAWQIYLSARTSGKTVTVGNIAFYAGRLVGSGRKMAGSSSTDALSEGALAREKMPAHVSLEALGGDSRAFRRFFGDHRFSVADSGPRGNQHGLGGLRGPVLPAGPADHQNEEGRLAADGNRLPAGNLAAGDQSAPPYSPVSLGGDVRRLNGPSLSRSHC